MVRTGGKTSSKPKEKDIQNLILQWLMMQRDCMAWQNDNVGIYDSARKVYRSRPKYALAGIADILGIWRGLPLAIEVKRPGGKVSPLQTAFLDRFELNGGISIIAYSLDDVLRELNSIS